jgi:uncharacterized protein YbbC (DUF1343 family)
MKTGLDVLLDRRRDLLRGRRIGLITNPTGVDRALVGSIERLRGESDINLVALYGPEHGVRGDAQAGEPVASGRDAKSGLPVFSLYGANEKPPAARLRDIDATMRAFDTQHTGKTVAPAVLQGIDVLVFDLQDVGTRIYTYIATMAFAMQAAAEAGIAFVVLDRPNPINGSAMEGPVLEYPEHSSFIGLYPIPLRHGMTAGELARLFNEKFLERRVDLHVVAMEGWSRSGWFDDTGLPWVLPSPNLPTLDSATVYPGQVILEGTNLSEGRGTTKPFELFGAPWIDGYELARALNALGLPGARFRDAYFTPTFSKFAGERCGGCQLHVIDREAFRPVATTLAIIQAVRASHRDRLEFHAGYFDKVMGTSTVREALLQGDAVETIVGRWSAGRDAFARLQEPFLLYR